MHHSKIAEDITSSEDTSSIKKNITEVASAVYSHPDLSTLLYENLPYIDIDDYSAAVMHVANGNERELLKLIARKKNLSVN